MAGTPLIVTGPGQNFGVWSPQAGILTPASPPGRLHGGTPTPESPAKEIVGVGFEVSFRPSIKKNQPKFAAYYTNDTKPLILSALRGQNGGSLPFISVAGGSGVVGYVYPYAVVEQLKFSYGAQDNEITAEFDFMGLFPESFAPILQPMSSSNVFLGADTAATYRGGAYGMESFSWTLKNNCETGRTGDPGMPALQPNYILPNAESHEFELVTLSPLPESALNAATVSDAFLALSGALDGADTFELSATGLSPDTQVVNQTFVVKGVTKYKTKLVGGPGAVSFS
jgi:hypothetical protein